MSSPSGKSPPGKPFSGFARLESNFTMTPNQFFEQVVGFYPYCVVTVVAILIRSTIGWQDENTGERRIESEVPLSQFLRPELSEASARKGVRLAIEAGLILQTAAATNKDGARYALRWSDTKTQMETIQRQRKSLGTEVRKSRGGLKSRPLKNRPLESRGLKSRPLDSAPLHEGTLKETPESEKKEEKKKESSLALSSEGETPNTCAAALKLDAMTIPPSKFDLDWMRKRMTPEALCAQIDADPRILPAIKRNWDKLPERIQTEIAPIVGIELVT